MPELNDHKSRAHALLSASSAARWLACPPSAVAAAKYPSKDTVYTKEGTLAHEVAEATTRAALEGEVNDIPFGEGIDTEMIDCADRYADYILEQRSGPNSTVLLEQRLDFSPWVPEGFGTGDCIILQDNTLHIIDFKYGKGVEVSAVKNPQMRLYALGALNEFGLIYDVQEIKTHIFQPRIHNVSTEQLTIKELQEWGEKIKPVAAKAAEGKGRHKAGDHCRFCPHSGACPALAKACAAVFDDAGGADNIPTLTPEQLSGILTKEPMISHWLKAVKEKALADLLCGESIPGYKLVEGKLGNRKWKRDGAVLEKLLSSGFKTGEVTETLLLSPAKMDKAIGKKEVAELLSDLIDRAPGAPTVVPESDKRQPFSRLAEAQKDFS